MKKYNIEVNEKQYKVIASAVECYSRIGMGQFDVALQEQIYLAKPELAQDIRVCCERLKYLTTGIATNGSLGIAEATEHYRIARDIYWAMRHQIETRKHTVYSQDRSPICFGPCKMIQIKEVKGGKRKRS